MERAELRLPTAAAVSARVGEVELMAGASRVLPTLGAPSPLGTVVFSVCASRLEVAPRNGAWGLASGYALMGYACRAATDSGHPIREDLAASIVGELTFTRGGDVDYGRLLDRPGEIVALVDRVTQIAGEPGLLADIASAEHDAWTAFEAEASKRLRSHFLRRGASSAGLPTERQACFLLRLGFALRLLDEAAGESPAGLVRASRRPELDSDIPRESEAWLVSAAAICMDDYGADVEGLLDAGVPGVLGLRDARVFLESDAGAMAAAHARFGYALREHEQCSPQARVHSDDSYSKEAIALARIEDLPELVCDVVRYGYCGGSASAIGSVPGASAVLRTAVLEEWSDSRRQDVPCRSDEEIAALVRYGYLLRRALELRHRSASPGTRVDVAAVRGIDGGD